MTETKNEITEKKKREGEKAVSWMVVSEIVYKGYNVLPNQLSNIKLDSQSYLRL